LADLRVDQALKWLALGVLVAGLAHIWDMRHRGDRQQRRRVGPFIMIAQFFIAGGMRWA
jgi:hypothetical protein